MNKLIKKQKGFTIIEVLIVLAIAGVIMLVVFLAVPQLQRNSRNTQRKSDAGHLLNILNEYKATNLGAVPASLTVPASEKFSILNPGASVTINTTASTQAFPGSGSYAAPTTDVPQMYSNTVCSGNNPVYNGSSRAVTIWFYIEGSTTTQCIQS
jgi:prepilin-type N-terminal cleavage/methylation domain-containing protein